MRQRGGAEKPERVCDACASLACPLHRGFSKEEQEGDEEPAPTWQLLPELD